jgi:hypothetical protein
MTDPHPTRSFYPTPAWLIFGLLVVEGLLWLSERYRWFGFNLHRGWTVLIAVAVVGVAMLVMLGWFIVALYFRWGFQFSIRSLLVLTIAVAVPFSWLAVEMKEARNQQETAGAIERLGGTVAWSDPSGPMWLRGLLGDDSIEQDRFVYHVYLGNTSITDADLKNVKGMNRLRYLFLNGTRVSDGGLENLTGLTKLHALSLHGIQLSDAGLKPLAGLTQLQSLDLVGTHVTDDGLKTLDGLNRLEFLFLEGTKVTDKGLKKLQQALPNCKITR